MSITQSKIVHCDISIFRRVEHWLPSSCPLNIHAKLIESGKEGGLELVDSVSVVQAVREGAVECWNSLARIGSDLEAGVLAAEIRRDGTWRRDDPAAVLRGGASELQR